MADEFDKLEKETQDEIEKIMDEIDVLQDQVKSDSPELDEEVTQKLKEVIQVEADESAETESEAEAAEEEDADGSSEVPPEEDFDSIAEEIAEEHADTLAEIRAGASDDSGMEDAVGDISQDEIHQSSSTLFNEGDEGSGQSDPKSVPKSKPAPTAPTTPTPSHATVTPLPGVAGRRDVPGGGSGNGRLSMVLSGDMTLDLKYDNGQDEISVSFEGDTLVIRLDSGAEFRVPLKPGQSSRKNSA